MDYRIKGVGIVEMTEGASVEVGALTDARAILARLRGECAADHVAWNWLNRAGEHLDRVEEQWLRAAQWAGEAGEARERKAAREVAAAAERAGDGLRELARTAVLGYRARRAGDRG